MRSQESPHRRYNPLANTWVLVSAHRLTRPWLGEQLAQKKDPIPRYDKACYLCPGNHRAQNKVNPHYESVYVFTNDFPALLPQQHKKANLTGLFKQEAVAGVCKVICYSPRHDLTLCNMSLQSIKKVIDTWAEQTSELGEEFAYVQIFENKGQMVGCSNPHPHGQIWACDYIPSEIACEHFQQDQYFEQNGSYLLMDYLKQEERATQKGDNRFIIHNEHWAALVPYWAYWPFEALVLPKRPVSSLTQLKAFEREALAESLKQLCAKYDRLFNASFPYVMGWHGEAQARHQHRLLHAHFYPPLLRSAEIRKYRAGFEMLAEAQRDLTPELAAQRLREV